MSSKAIAKQKLKEKLSCDMRNSDYSYWFLTRVTIELDCKIIAHIPLEGSQ
jgi:hypothetical protein